MVNARWWRKPSLMVTVAETVSAPVVSVTVNVSVCVDPV